MPMGVIKGEEQQPDHPTVARHSAFPHPQDRQRRAQHFGIIKENVTEPSTDDDTEKRGPSNKVSDFCHGQIGISVLRQPEEKDKAGDKCQDIGQTVPARANIVVDPKKSSDPDRADSKRAFAPILTDVADTRN